MRQRDKTMAERLRKLAFFGSMILLGLAVVGVRESHAQMFYKGGFTPVHRNPPKIPDPQPAKTPAPSTPSSYFPDNDSTYPLFYRPVETKRSQPSAAGAWLYNALPSDLPWNRADYEDYNEPPAIPRDAALGKPKKYLLMATPLVPDIAAERVENAALIAHLPEHAVLWVEGTRTRSTGRTRYFQSPPLLPGQKYNYRVSAAWIEDGHWVSHTRLVPVQAGLLQAIYLEAAPRIPAKAAMDSRPTRGIISVEGYRISVSDASQKRRRGFDASAKRR